MKRRRVFYHVEGWFGKLPPMDEPRDDASTDTGAAESGPGDSAPSQPPAVSAALSDSASKYGLITPSAFEQRVHKVFIGPDGLRPVWRFAFYLIVYRALYFALQIVMYDGLPDLGQLRLQAVAYLGLAVVAVAATAIMARIEGRPLRTYGLPLRRAFGKMFWTGLLWGLISLSLLLLVLHEAKTFDFGTMALHGARLAKFAAFWAALYLSVGIYEEVFTRGYPQFTLTQAVGFWPAAILLSIGFGLLHVQNPGESWVGILGAIAIGFFFCLTLRRTGNLWFAVGFHTSWDWGESFLFSVPNSGAMVPGHLLHSSLHGSIWVTGGSVGPEGSIFLFVLIALLWIAFARLYPDVKYPEATP
ncbi:MAG: lysostaphin resistance A-like protein [Terriglobales bacterium]